MKRLLNLVLVMIFIGTAFSVGLSEEKTPVQLLSEAINNYRSESNETNFQQALTLIDDIIASNENSGYMLAVKSYLYSLHSAELLDQSRAYLKEMNFGQKFFIGNQYLDKHNYSPAIELYKEAIKDNPNSTCVWRHKGEAYYRLKDYDNAVRAIKRSIELKEDHTDAYLWLAFAYIELKNYKDALQAINKGIYLYEKGIPGCEDEELYEYYELKGDILVMLDRPEEAAKVYNMALKHSADNERIQKKLNPLPK